jgi:carboxymethylenebutenolidase
MQMSTSVSLTASDGHTLEAYVPDTHEKPRGVIAVEALPNVQAAMAYGQGHGKVGIVGYCWGGTVAWLAACRTQGLSAAVCYYGGSIPKFEDEHLRVATMLHFGESDHSLPIDKAKVIAAKHPDAQSHYYAAGHGFNCDARGSFDATQAAVARERTMAFFGKHLG